MESMTRMFQDQLGRCDFIDVLEEAVLHRRPVTVELRDGSARLAAIRDVVTENGRDLVVLDGGERFPVEAIAAVSRP
jgi:Rho-binding antiterminator